MINAFYMVVRKTKKQTTAGLNTGFPVKLAREKLDGFAAFSCLLSTIVEENKKVRSEKKNLAIRSSLVRCVISPFKCHKFRHFYRR